MSTAEAISVLKKQIGDALNNYTRGTLDQQVHVIDISYNSLLASNKRKDTTTYSSDYSEFLFTVYNEANIVEDYLQALTLVNNNKGTCILEDGGSIILVNKNFNTARDFITKISRLIKNNESFGVSFRSRNYQDIESTRDFSRANGSQFLLNNETGYGIYKIDKLPGTNRYGLIPVEGYQNVKEIYYLAQRRSVEYSKSTFLTTFNNTEVEIDKSGKVIEKKSLYSVLDLGHGQGLSQVQATPLGKKLLNVLELGISEKGKALVNSYMNELVKLHNVVSFEFNNTSNNNQASGYVVISIQNYKRNNVLSVAEGAILSKLRKNIEKLLPNIPGSNTIIEDAIQITRNKVISTILNKPSEKIKKHKPAKGSVLPKVSSKQASNSKVQAARQSITLSAKPTIRSSEQQLYSLTSLQNLINKHLQDVISANMGDGNSRNVLNYRTGLLAASAKVERMSQSREGMITAFYSYMKNPYATFSDGGQQQYPKSRDPKLLISKSIREIAAEKVGNRLRAVVV